jgi:glycosyltransferase involved in cell wall biosynthesis
MAFPKASIVLLTYNQEQFVVEAFSSLLAQDYQDLEIIVSDDCSRDTTWSIIQSIADSYSGSKKIILRRNEKNLGIVANYAAALEQCTGEVVFTAAGDDRSDKTRCSECIQFWLASKQQPDLIATDAFDLSLDGKVLGIKENHALENWDIQKWFHQRPYFFGASHMMTRRLLQVGDLNPQLPYEDQSYVFRALLMGGAMRLPKPLVYHRRGGLTQITRFQFGHRRLEIIRGMQRELLELQQFLSDAIALSQKDTIEFDVNLRKNYCQAILRLFEKQYSIHALRVFWLSKWVTQKDKYRYTRYYLFYPLLAIAHACRDLIRFAKNK